MTLPVIILIISIILIIIFLYPLFTRKKKVMQRTIDENDRKVLEQYVAFYRELDPEKRTEFEERMHHFLTSTHITGVNVEVERLDELLVAASAIIPIFGFKNWEYMNLNEVLLYPDSFNEHFEQEGNDRTRLGVIGDGPYQNIMILSRHELRQGFINQSGKSNTAIHEFVHLVDKTDGSVDGVPEALVSKQYVLPWLRLMRKKIQEIENEDSDINVYGATNEAEFFAVVSEYFFERPDLLKEKHPELYELLSVVFRKE